MLNTDNAVIRAENIAYKVKDKTILSDISFAVGKGTLTSIVGMNGSGKTTLLKLIGGIIKPVSGYVSINNKDVADYKVKDLAQNVSMVFQSNETDFDFSALQIVLMGRMPYQKLLDRDKAEDFAVCEQAMKETNTWQLKDRLINSLSGGERQRVFIARSLAQQTDIMLLDEPVANLDLKHQIEIMNLLKSIQQRNNTTVLIVLHDLSLALKYSDNVLALKNGRLHFFDCAKNVLTTENIRTLFEINAQVSLSGNVIME